MHVPRLGDQPLVNLLYRLFDVLQSSSSAVRARGNNASKSRLLLANEYTRFQNRSNTHDINSLNNLAHAVC